MADPFIGEIKLWSLKYAPMGWAYCNGQLLNVQQNPALFAVIGNVYGGDGQTNFALPNLQSRLPIHQGAGPGLSTRVLAETGGTETVTVTVNQLPSHTHIPNSSSTASGDSPANSYWGTTSAKPYGAVPGNAVMNAASVGIAGGSQPHDNMIPYLCVSFIISLFGIYPSPT